MAESFINITTIAENYLGDDWKDGFIELMSPFLMETVSSAPYPIRWRFVEEHDGVARIEFSENRMTIDVRHIDGESAFYANIVVTDASHQPITHLRRNHLFNSGDTINYINDPKELPT